MPTFIYFLELFRYIRISTNWSTKGENNGTQKIWYPAQRRDICVLVDCQKQVQEFLGAIFNGRTLVDSST